MDEAAQKFEVGYVNNKPYKCSNYEKEFSLIVTFQTETHETFSKLVFKKTHAHNEIEMRAYFSFCTYFKYGACLTRTRREEFQNEFNIANVYYNDDGCLQYGSLSQSNILEPVGRLLHIFAVCTKVEKFAR